jgi:hypothetical protein
MTETADLNETNTDHADHHAVRYHLTLSKNKNETGAKKELIPNTTGNSVPAPLSSSFGKLFLFLGLLIRNGKVFSNEQ